MLGIRSGGAVMECRHCGLTAASDSRECSGCGAPFYYGCPFCGFDNLPNGKYCSGCARAIEQVRAPAFLDAGVQSDRRSRAEAERKQVTVMFADIQASHELADTNDPEATREGIESVLEVMVEAVHEFDGTVAQVLGDGVMALFGAPMSQEDHAVRACYAALAMHEHLRQRDWELEGSLTIQPRIRIGLHSGDVVISAVSSDLGWDYRAVGATTHIAARLEQMAQPGTTLASGATNSLAKGLVKVEPLGKQLIKGVLQPIDAYRIVGGTDVSRFQATVAGGVLSPFVGRETELAMLRRLLSEVRNGARRVLSVQGVPGIGKSRLLFEFLHHLPTDFIVLEAGAPSCASSPYVVVERLLRNQLGVSVHDEPKHVTERLDAILAESPSLLVHRPALCNLFNIPTNDIEWRSLDPTQRRSRTIAAIRAALRAVSRSRPVVLLCEDLQWFDDESLELLKSLIDDPHEGGVLFVLTFRLGTVELPEAFTSSTYTLGPLTTANSSTLVSKLVGEHRDLAALRENLTRVTGGNPFFIEETVRSFVETGVLVGEIGAYIPGPNPASTTIPASVEGVIGARIDRVPADARQILTAAAVIGDDIELVLLKEMLGLDEDTLRARLADLEGLEMLRLDREVPTPVYRFRHYLIRDVIYGRLLTARRRALHGKVFDVLEKIHAGRLETQSSQLAEHAYKAQRWEQAVRCHLIDCGRAVSRSAHRYAVDALNRGLESLSHLPPAPSATVIGIDLRLAGLAPLLTLGERDRMLVLVREAELMARSISDERRLGAVYSQLATGLWMASQHDLAFQAARDAHRLAEAQGNFSLVKAALHNMGMVHHAHGNFDKAIETFEALVAEFVGERERQRFGWVGYPCVFCRTFLASSLTFVGRFNDALRRFDEGIRMADELDHPYSRSIIREELAYCHLLMGRSDLAVQVLREAQEICDTHDVKTMVPALAGRMASALAHAGRAQEGVELAERHLDLQTFRLGGRYAHNFLLLGKAEANLSAGKLLPALDAARELQTMTKNSSEHAYAAGALLVLGCVFTELGRDRWLEAESALENARSMARQRGMRPLEANCSLSLGDLFDRGSRWPEAELELRRAATIFDELHLDASRKLIDDRITSRRVG